jgi:catechol 2,3-dioxygenase-like lactoylglutathione lyase family enzyme
MSDTNPVTVHFENSQPILRVESMEASLRFYVGKLGFKNAEWGSQDFTCISREGACLYLCLGGQGRGGAWVWMGVEDAEKLHDELKAQGVAIRSPLTHHSWALEFQIEDPDGNVLRLGSDPK